MKQAIARHDDVVKRSIESADGAVFTTAGDAFCAAFSSPRRALDAAIGAQLALRAQDWAEVGDLRVRMALHTGNADERGGDYFGPPLNRCARLLAIGHGGQILVSATTAGLLVQDLPPEVSLNDLGTHMLKDMDREEHVFEVTHPSLMSDFAELRSERTTPTLEQLLTEARRAHDDDEWQAAYHGFAMARETGELSSGDLHRFADTAFWTGRIDEAVPLKELAYAGLIGDGDHELAALTALDLALLYKYRLATAIAKAWVARAEKLVTGHEGGRSHGYLQRWKAVYAFETTGDPDAALAYAESVIQIAREIGDRSLEALGLMDKGRFLVAIGRIDEGMKLVDESMIAAVAGEINADAIGRNYCNMLGVCDQIADYERASEWSDAAEAWCEKNADSAYPGICRVFRAELKWLQGDWESATSDLRNAMDELAGFTPLIGAALYQIGLVELRRGNHSEAESNFRSANEHGFPPLPGMAELRLREGDPLAGEQMVLDALLSNPRPLDRARFLPTLIDIEIALGNTSEVDSFLTELASTAELCDSTAMRAQTSDRRGSVALAGDDPGAATRYFGEAVRGWTHLRMPFEAAQSRMQLGAAYRMLGNEGSASMEIQTAQATLDRLMPAEK